MQYRHTQRGTLVWCMTAPLFLVSLAVYATGQGAWWALLPAGFCALILLLFGALTVSVDDRFVRVAYGVGLVALRFPLADMEAVEAVRNPWYYFWGIRWYGRGWLYNISGLDGVRISMTNGKEIRIGTDEPAKLAEVIRMATHGPRRSPHTDE